MEGDRAVEETPDFGGAVDIEEEADVNMLLRFKPETQAEPTTVVNPQFCSERYRQWVDLLALNFIRSNQRRGMIRVRSIVLASVRATDFLNQSLKSRKPTPATMIPALLSKASMMVRSLLTLLLVDLYP